jgi:hypothetical protein
MFHQIEDVKFIEPDYYQVFNENKNKFHQFNGYHNNCANTVKTYLSLIGLDTSKVTAWADTVRNLGQVLYDPNKLQEGDVVAMGRPGNTWHVGVYLGNGKILHQSAMRGYVVGVFKDLNAFIHDRRGFYIVRPSNFYNDILQGQFYLFPQLT